MHNTDSCKKLRLINHKNLDLGFVIKKEAKKSVYICSIDRNNVFNCIKLIKVIHSLYNRDIPINSTTENILYEKKDVAGIKDDLPSQEQLLTRIILQSTD